MRLWSGAPYWLLRGGLLDEPISPPCDCDVAVIGAGITGALVADSLTAAGFSVTVLDRRAPSEGSTAACTGILTYELDVSLTDLTRMIGEDRAVRCYRASVEGVRMLAALVDTLPHRCGFTWRESLYLGSSRRDGRALEEEARRRQQATIDSVFVSSSEVEGLCGLRSYGALRTSVSAIVDAVRLTRALLDRAVGAGAVLCAQTTVLEWSTCSDGATVKTDRGDLHAKWVVVATGYETPSQLRGDFVSLHSSYALATAPIDDGASCPREHIIWNTERPYFYLRPAEDGRIVIGGEDVPFRDAAWRDRLMPDRIRRLEKRLRAMLPHVCPETEFMWAGTFAETRDGLPYIGPHRDIPRALFALGYGGNGIVFSAIAARIIRDIVLGEGHEYLDLFSFER